MTLGVLAPYRRGGIGRKLMEDCLTAARSDPSLQAITLHVQTSNELALDFYKKFGFELVDTVPGYYVRIDPPDAYILRLDLTSS